MTPGPILLSRSDLDQALDMGACMDAVEKAFLLHGEGKAQLPAALAAHVEHGGFHVKAGVLDLGRPVFIAKVNANFPANPAKGRATIQGVAVLFDARDGTPLALLDSGSLTARRTGAATGVAARHLARQDSATATLVGCGAQAMAQLEALRRALPALRRVHALDLDPARAAAFAKEAGARTGLAVEPAADLAAATLASDVVVTCTTARRAFLHPDMLKEGAFVAAVGTDHPDKQEVAPALLAASKVVVDVLDQAAAFGDLSHALDAKAMRREDVHAELGQVVAGLRPGRTAPEETFVFDSTGMGLQDAAAAWVAHERAARTGLGTPFPLAA